MTARSTSASSSNRALYLTLLVVAVVVVALLGVAVVARDDDGGDGAGSAGGGLDTAPVEIEGDPLPAFPDTSGLADPASDPAVGLQAPTLRGVSFDGTPVVVSGDGTPKLVLFLAHWCPHCQREVPKVQALVDEGRVPDDVRIVAVSTAVDADRGNHPPSAWLADEHWTSPVLADDQPSSAARSYGLIAFPYGVYVDGENQVLARTSGEIETDVIEGLLQQLSEA